MPDSRTFEFLKLIINLGHQKIKEQEQLGLRGLSAMIQLSSETKNVTIILGGINSWSVWVWGGRVCSGPQGSTSATLVILHPALRLGLKSDTVILGTDRGGQPGSGGGGLRTMLQEEGQLEPTRTYGKGIVRLLLAWAACTGAPSHGISQGVTEKHLPGIRAVLWSDTQEVLGEEQQKVRV